MSNGTWNPQDDTGGGDTPKPSPNTGAQHAVSSDRDDWQEFFAFLKANAAESDEVEIGDIDDILGGA